MPKYKVSFPVEGAVISIVEAASDKEAFDEARYEVDEISDLWIDWSWSGCTIEQVDPPLPKTHLCPSCGTEI